MRIIDLTHDITTGMMVYPGDPAVHIGEALTHEVDYCHVNLVKMGSHTGTHIDAPFHFLPNGKTITDYPVSKFIGPGLVVDISGKKANEAIFAQDLEGAAPMMKQGDILVISTGWYRYFGTDTYLSHPYLSGEAASFLVEQGISIVAVDFLNVDSTMEERWDAHPILLGEDVLIVENLNNVTALTPGRRYQFALIPLKIQGSDGSPIRAIAMEEA